MRSRICDFLSCFLPCLACACGFLCRLADLCDLCRLHFLRLACLCAVLRRLRRVLVAAVRAVRRDVLPRHLHAAEEGRCLQQVVKCLCKGQTIRCAVAADQRACPAADADGDALPRPGRPLGAFHGGALALLCCRFTARRADNLAANRFELFTALYAILFHDDSPSCRSRGIHMFLFFSLFPWNNYIITRRCVYVN